MTDNISLFKSCPCPARSPWGAIQTKRELAPGIWSVSTAGHGGIKLSRERNAGVPDYMRAEGGWYEEDCQWSIAAMIYPGAFQRVVQIDGRPDKTEYDYALDSFRGWYPDEYERFFNVKLLPGESRSRDERIFIEETKDKFVLRSAWGDWASWVPKGKVGVCARRASDGAEKWFLIGETYTERRAKGMHGIVIDPSVDTEIEKPENP
ncbi:DUF7007 domain-containing protein [Bradyrhizobium ottawaense]|uniref:DUF7007 domain-containing protein n=1 Tax=Bradyrhizobium ottawaense TaxID=931866 RepID=A0ABY0QHB4_9BRAD|nr:hypothetical protein [Bradyrhizobium ottawaense]SDK43538.1 hypothetical protein SAMN05444163_8105 [Bradyrhizobium ottawaense]